MREPIVVLCSVPSPEVGERIAEALVGDGLAACVNVLGEMRSVYRWKGAVERDREQMCLIKTTRDVFAEVVERVTALHPYEVPELVALAIADGNAPYLEWLLASVTASRG